MKVTDSLNRRHIKQQFLLTLSPAHQTYLRAKAHSPVHAWHNELLAREICQAAKGAGVYKAKTVVSDVLSGLRNHARRFASPPALEPAERGRLLMAALCPQVPESGYVESLEQALGDLAAYAETLKDSGWRNRPFTTALVTARQLP